MNDPVLRLNGITKAYKRGTPGEVTVLSGVDLQVAPGEVVALVAPSGAGKSTLLHIAGLLDEPDAGQVVIAGQDMTGRGDKTRTATRRRDVGFVYQFHHLLPEFSAAENIILPQLANGVPAAQVFGTLMELVADTGLSALIATHNLELAAQMDRVLRLEGGTLSE